MNVPRSIGSEIFIELEDLPETLRSRQERVSVYNEDLYIKARDNIFAPNVARNIVSNLEFYERLAPNGTNIFCCFRRACLGLRMV